MSRAIRKPDVHTFTSAFASRGPSGDPTRQLAAYAVDYYW